MQKDPSIDRLFLGGVLIMRCLLLSWGIAHTPLSYPGIHNGVHQGLAFQTIFPAVWVPRHVVLGVLRLIDTHHRQL